MLLYDSQLTSRKTGQRTIPKYQRKLRVAEGTEGVEGIERPLAKLEVSAE